MILARVVTLNAGYNAPDYGITHLGFQVYEQVCYNQQLNTKPMTGIWNTLVG